MARQEKITPWPTLIYRFRQEWMIDVSEHSDDRVRKMRIILKYHLHTALFITAAIISILSMEIKSFHSYQGMAWAEYIFSSLMVMPAFVMGVYCSLVWRKTLKASRLKDTKDIVKLDFSIIGWVCALSLFLYLLVNTNNTDVLGWWPYIALTGFIECVIFAGGYALISIPIKKHHYPYTLVASVILFSGFTLVSLFNQIGWQWIFYLIGAHIGICLINAISNFIRDKYHETST